jgi:subtilisin family serine protease
VNSDGVAVPHSVARGIVWLMENGVSLIALPIGSAMVHEEVADALAAASKHAIFFAAAGSGWSNELLFPARERAPIAVAASDDGGTLCFHGGDTSRIDLVAPGWNIVGSISSNRSVERTGSSVACVMAAAVAALALSFNGFGSRSCSRRTLLRMLCGTGLRCKR